MSWYEYPTNYSNGTSIDGVGSFFFQYPNIIAGGWLGTAIVLLIFIISFTLSLMSGSRKALLVSSFVSFIFAIWFVRLDMINPVVVITLIILMIIGAIGSSSKGQY